MAAEGQELYQIKTIKNSLFCVGLRLAFANSPRACEPVGSRLASSPLRRRTVSARPTQNKRKTGKNPFAMKVTFVVILMALRPHGFFMVFTLRCLKRAGTDRSRRD